MELDAGRPGSCEERGCLQNSKVSPGPAPWPPGACSVGSHLQLSFFSAGMQFKVRDADGCDNMPLPPGVAGTVGEDNFIVALTSP